MKAYRVVMSFDEVDGFSADILKAKLIKSLGEVGLRLLDFEYQKNAKDICADIPVLNRKLSVCRCLVEFKEFSTIPYERIVLGSISSLEHEYPYFTSFSIEPDWIDIIVR